MERLHPMMKYGNFMEVYNNLYNYHSYTGKLHFGTNYIVGLLEYFWEK